MAEKSFWMQRFPKLIGTLVGIVLTAIGGVMTLNVVLKVYVFGFTTNSYFSAEDQCKFEDYSLVKEGEKAKLLKGEERTACIAEKTKIENDRYLRDKKENLVDGAAMLLLGIPFWIIFARRKEEK